MRERKTRWQAAKWRKDTILRDQQRTPRTTEGVSMSEGFIQMRMYLSPPGSPQPPNRSRNLSWRKCCQPRR